jgi:hypothetical protein
MKTQGANTTHTPRLRRDAPLYRLRCSPFPAWNGEDGTGPERQDGPASGNDFLVINQHPDFVGGKTP